MKEKHQNEISFLQNNLRSKKENLRAKKDKEISDLNDKFDLELSILRLKLNQLNSSKEKTISDFVKNLKDEMNQLHKRR